MAQSRSEKKRTQSRGVPPTTTTTTPHRDAEHEAAAVLFHQKTRLNVIVQHIIPGIDLAYGIKGS